MQFSRLPSEPTREEVRSRIPALLAATILALLAVTAATSDGSAAQESARKYTVVLVAGWGSPYQDQVEPVKALIEADGFPVEQIAALPNSSSYIRALAIAAKVRSVARAEGKANLVCYSAAVAICRFAMKYLGIEDLVAAVVLFAGGDGNYNFCLIPAWIGGDACQFHAFARSINIGDDTPGPAGYYFITSYTQQEAPPLDGGVCYKQVVRDGSFRHGDEPKMPVYQEFIIAGLNGICLGDFLDLPIR